MNNGETINLRDAPTSPTSMSITGRPSTIYDKKSFELSVTTRSTKLPFSDATQLEVPDNNNVLPFVVPFNSVFRRLVENDLYNERLLCVVNGGDPYYGANLINNLCAILSNDANTYVYSPTVKSQPVQLIRQTDANVEESLKNKIGYNFAYHQRLIDNGTLSSAGYSDYLNFVRNRLSSSSVQASKYLRYVPSDFHTAVYHAGVYYFGTNHGIFTCTNPFLDNTETSVVWPFGQSYVEGYENSNDPLQAGLFNQTAVYEQTQKTMLGDDVSDAARDPNNKNFEDLFPWFNVYTILPVELSGSLSSIEVLVGTDHGLWALLNTSTPEQAAVTSVSTYMGWEEDQISAAVVSYEWVQCNSITRNCLGEEIYLQDLSVMSIVQSDEDRHVENNENEKTEPVAFYLGTTNGLFKFKISGTSLEPVEDEYSGGDPEDVEYRWVVNAYFNQVYGYSDVTVSSMVFVHPEGYNGSVLAGTNVGVLHAADGWFPNIQTVIPNWIKTGEYYDPSTDPPLAVALQGPTPVMVGTATGLYTVGSNTNPENMYQCHVHAIYDNVIPGSWTVLANGSDASSNNVYVLQVFQPEPPQTKPTTVAVVSALTGVGTVAKHLLSQNGTLYFTAENDQEKVYFTYSLQDGDSTVTTTTNFVQLPESAISNGERIVGFTVATCQELNWADVLFVATRKWTPGNESIPAHWEDEGNIYVLLPQMSIRTDMFVVTNRIQGGSGIQITGRAHAPNCDLDLTFYQASDGTFAVESSQLANAMTEGVSKKINSYATTDNTIRVVNLDGHDVLVSRGGVFLVQKVGSDWQIGPTAVLEGTFTGAAVLQFMTNSGTIANFLTLADVNGKLYLCSATWDDLGTPTFVQWDSMAGLNGSSPNVVPSPLNDETQLEALVVHSNKVKSVFVEEGSSTQFDAEGAVQTFTDITLPE